MKNKLLLKLEITYVDKDKSQRVRKKLCYNILDFKKTIKALEEIRKVESWTFLKALLRLRSYTTSIWCVSSYV